MPGSSASPQERIEQQAGEAAAKAREVKEAAARKATETYEQAKSGAADLARQASEYLHQATQSQKGVLAGKVDEYRDAARAASEKLKEEQHGPVAERVERIAGQLDRLSGYLRNTEPAALLEDVEDFARRRPEVVLGTMFVAGLAAARFLKASKRRSSPQMHEQRYSAPVPTRSYEGAGSGSCPAEMPVSASSPAPARDVPLTASGSLSGSTPAASI
jgi:gas vesicle protein